MARFPDVEVERLKREVSIERLAVSAGVPLGARGDDLVGVCPFCAAADALVVSPAPNLWQCGGCGAGGSVIDWVMAAEGVSTRHALELLRDGFTPSRLNGKPPGRSTVHRLGGPFSADLADAELLDAVVGFYHQSLLESPEARGYLAERRIADGEAVDRFRLGYANRTLGYRLPAVNRAPGKALRGRLKDLGGAEATDGPERTHRGWWSTANVAASALKSSLSPPARQSSPLTPLRACADGRDPSSCTSRVLGGAHRVLDARGTHTPT
jgi:DNA primase